jgi:hypothetical protein
MGSLHWLVRTPDQAVVCADYRHPGAEEPMEGTFLDVRGGEFSGGPWCVTAWGYGNVLRGEANWLEVEVAGEQPKPPRRALEVPETDW